jgi:hypothetical protein
MQRNLWFSKLTSLILFHFYDPTKPFIDYAAGYGIFVRLMRDYGFSFYWEDKYCKNLVALGFEKPSDIKTYEAVTAFEVFEHFEDPLTEINEIMKLSNTIIFSTELFKPSSLDEDWWYFSPHHGQHIGFYSEKTLLTIADKLNLNFCTNGSNFHLFTPKKISMKAFNKTLRSHDKNLTKIFSKKNQTKTMSDHKLISSL